MTRTQSGTNLANPGRRGHLCTCDENGTLHVSSEELVFKCVGAGGGAVASHLKEFLIN